MIDDIETEMRRRRELIKEVMSGVRDNSSYFMCTNK